MIAISFWRNGVPEESDGKLDAIINHPRLADLSGQILPSHCSVEIVDGSELR